MPRRAIPQRGDIDGIDLNPVASREMKDRHRFVAITRRDINALGICMAVPVTNEGTHPRNMGLAVAITGHDTNGVAIRNQVRSFDIEARVRDGNARFIEAIDPAITEEIVARVSSVTDPAA